MVFVVACGASIQVGVCHATQDETGEHGEDLAIAMLFILRDAAGAHGSARLIGLAATNGADRDVLDRELEMLSGSFENFSRGILRKYMAGNTHDLDSRRLLEGLIELQEATSEEIDAAKQLIASDLSPASRERTLQANGAYNEVVARVASMLGPFLEQSSQRKGAREIPRGDQAGQFPISWEQGTQMTGPESGTVHFIRDEKGNPRRVEARYARDLLVAVTEVEEGFRVTLGSDLAVTDFATRPWFTKAESDGLIEAWGDFIDGNLGGKDEKVIGRFRVQAEKDPEFPLKNSLVLRNAAGPE